MKPSAIRGGGCRSARGLPHCASLRSPSKDEREPQVGLPSRCGGFEVPAKLAASPFRIFKSKNRTRVIGLLVPLLIPKFASEGVASASELRNRDTSPTCLFV